MNIKAIVESTLVLPAAQKAMGFQAERIGKLEAVLREIVDEYDNTYGAASIPVEVMERAKALLR